MEIIKKTGSIIASIMAILIFGIYLKSLLEFIFLDGWTGQAIAFNFAKFHFYLGSTVIGIGVFIWLTFILLSRVVGWLFFWESDSNYNISQFPESPIQPKISAENIDSGGGVSLDDSIIDRVGQLTLKYMDSENLLEFNLNDYTNVMFTLFDYISISGIQLPAGQSEKRKFIESCLSKFHNFKIDKSRVILVDSLAERDKVYSDKKESDIAWNTIDKEEKKIRSGVINGALTEEDLKDFLESRGVNGEVKS